MEADSTFPTVTTDHHSVKRERKRLHHNPDVEKLRASDYDELLI
jgi:hypothetical protein